MTYSKPDMLVLASASGAIETCNGDEDKTLHLVTDCLGSKTTAHGYEADEKRSISRTRETRLPTYSCFSIISLQESWQSVVSFLGYQTAPLLNCPLTGDCDAGPGAPFVVNQQPVKRFYDDGYNPRRKELTTMNYSKPDMLVLASAPSVIELSGDNDKLRQVVIDTLGGIKTTANAYEADE